MAQQVNQSAPVTLGDVTIDSADGAIVDGVSAAIKATVSDLTNSNPVHVALVDGDGTHITSIGGGTQYTEDAAAAANPVGNMQIARRKDTLSDTEVSADGDNIAVNATAKGEVYVKHTDAVPVTDNSGSLTIDAASLPLPTGASTEVTLLLVESAVDGLEGLLATIDGDTGVLAGTVAGSEVQVDVVTLPAVTNAGTFPVQDRPETANGLDTFRSLDLDESEEQVKATAGQIYTLWFTNTATSTRWLKFYNDTAANVTVGTTTPQLTIGLPGNSSDDISGVFSTAKGWTFSSAITVAATTGVADNDIGAPGANEVIVNIGYK